jgi:hypothetical protein
MIILVVVVVVVLTREITYNTCALTKMGSLAVDADLSHPFL